MGATEACATALGEAVTLYRGLAAADPALYTPLLAQALTELARTLEELDRFDQALECRAENVARWSHLARLRPRDYDNEVARARADLAEYCSERRYAPADALRATYEASRRSGLESDATTE